jgi:hypothetical protein
MKYDLDVVINRVAQIEYKLNEVLYSVQINTTFFNITYYININI